MGGAVKVAGPSELSLVRPPAGDADGGQRHAEHSTVAFARTLISEEARAAALRVLASGWVTTGPEVAEFEREFAAWVGAEHAIAVSSCTAALELSLAGLGLPPGARVLTPTMTFCGAVQAILHAGLQPVLVDCDPYTMTVTPAQVAEASRRIGGADAMVALHYAGYPAPVAGLADAAGLPIARVIEDAAHALGTKVGDRWVGTTSAATCFSFYATKNLPIGEGGMVTTDDPLLAEYLSRARLHGMSRDAWRRYLPTGPQGMRPSWQYGVDVAGLKANMTDVQAAIGRAQLGHLARWQARRAELADRYDDLLRPVEGLMLPARPASEAAGLHAWHLYVVQVDANFGMSRDELVVGLEARGVGSSVHFIPIHHHAHFQRALRPASGLFAGADAAFERIVSLPLHPGLSDDDVARVVGVIVDLQTDARARVRRSERGVPGTPREVIDLRESGTRHLGPVSVLGRATLTVAHSRSHAALRGKRVLVTGAGGSIGTELSKQIDAAGPSELYMLDHDESNLHRLELELEGSGLLDNDRMVIADIRDRRRVEQLFAELRPQVVFHAAAHKHLPLLERHPCEGVKSNVLGTRNLADAAIASGAEAFVLISTDKAADPTSVLGATKRLAEMIVAARGGGATRFASVRFGNVFGSRGSFMDALTRQLERGEPVTVTHPEVTRYFMTVEEAVGLVIEAAAMTSGGETFVLDMGEPVRIVDIVHNAIRALGIDPGGVEVRYTGLRPGEKLTESLFSLQELRHPTPHPRIWRTDVSAARADLDDALDRLSDVAEANHSDRTLEMLVELLPEYSPWRDVPDHEVSLEPR